MKRHPFALLAVVLALTTGSAAAAQPAGVTINPTMARGPVGAPVTIVEFSDYQ